MGKRRTNGSRNARARIRWGVIPLVVTLAAALACAASAATAALAAGTYTGGPDDVVLSVPNDQTPIAFRFSATAGLTPNTMYYVKVRFSVAPTPSGSSNRGFTWNGTSGTWAQERADWTAFPTVTTDASGLIASTWEFAKFGDEVLSGPYYVLVSLSTGSSGTTLNNASPPVVTVMAMATSGFWVHDGVATTAVTKRAEADDHSDAAKVLALMRTEPNSVDDDANGIVDDEDYGPAGSSGDFRFAVPLNTAFDVFLNKVAWAPGQNVTGTQADVDIALGAADTSPPSAISGLQATPGDSQVSLVWTAATDNSSDPLTYAVYRWVAPAASSGDPSTPVPELMTKTTNTSYVDGSVANGTTYDYQVRAVDSATNVGPRAETGNVLPAAPTTLTLTTSTPVVNFGAAATFSGDLTSKGTPLTGESVDLQWSPDGVSNWQTVQTLAPTGSTNSYAATAVPPLGVRAYYRLSYAGRGAYAASVSSPAVSVTPRVSLTAPAAPKATGAKWAFIASGVLRPHKTSGAKSVRVLCYKRVNAKWVLKKPVSATNRNYTTASGVVTKYSVRLSLPSAGKWRLRAKFSPDGANALTLSAYRYVTVR
jgi:hypothetical protein